MSTTEEMNVESNSSQVTEEEKAPKAKQEGKMIPCEKQKIEGRLLELV